MASLDHVTTPSPSADRIRSAALTCFAAQGTAATSLRQIAEVAEVSIGLVQHHFGTKAQLVRAVDEHVMTVIAAALAGPMDPTGADPVGEFGRRVITLISEHTDVTDYLGRVLVDGNEFGSVIFDRMVAMGEARWIGHQERGLAPADLDITWASLNPLILVLGAIILRSHVDRHLPEPFTTVSQLGRWEDAVNALIRSGQFGIGGAGQRDGA